MTTLQIIARIHSDFPAKFGVPRQSGLASDLSASIVFEPGFRDANAVRGLEHYDYVWLIWGFSENKSGHWSPTVRPPRLGGNMHMGVFATRSPFRPNPLGLSALPLESVEIHPGLGPVLHVRGADLVDGTPIFDIKPYLPYADSFPEARSLFQAQEESEVLTVRIEDALLTRIPAEKRKGLMQTLAQDPRPAYIDDSERVYGLSFAGFNLRFRVLGGVLEVISIDRACECG